MPAVITAASTLICPHGFNMIVTPGRSLLTVDGQTVLVKGDLLRATFACLANPPCKSVLSIDGGLATTLTVGGDAVALATVTGTTNVTSSFSVVSANQTKLEAA
jgi:hypothetical protein